VLAQPRAEGGDDHLGVVASPVEPSVHRVLHPAAQRIEECPTRPEEPFEVSTERKTVITKTTAPL
jgi:hypothetical protein